MARSTRKGSGWKSSHRRKQRTESIPAPAIASKSAATSSGSNRVHHPIAVRAGQ